MSDETHANELMASLGDALKGITLPAGLPSVLVSGGEKALLALLQDVAKNVGTVNFGTNNALIQNVITVAIKLATQYLSTPTPAPVPPAPAPVVPTHNDVNVPVNVA